MLPQYRLLGVLQELESRLPATHDLVFPSRTVRLPLSFDDPSIAEAMARYRSGVRDTAPWLPSNTEFIRRINGLGSVDDVRKAVFDAEYLVLGLGDVYLGAPLAVPLDPRHRLVTTKYNPARTWTPSDAVGIAQVPVLVRHGVAGRLSADRADGADLVGLPAAGTVRVRQAWLFRFFRPDRVGARHPEQLEQARSDSRAGRFDADVSEGNVRTGRPPALPRGTRRIDRRVRGTAGGGVRGREAGVARGREFDRVDAGPAPEPATEELDVPRAPSWWRPPMVGNVWRWNSQPGQQVSAGDPAVVLEAMKLEMPVPCPVAGTVLQVLAEPGAKVAPGTPLAVIG